MTHKAISPAKNTARPGKKTKAKTAGMSQIIRCVPDPFTQETFNIGVCAWEHKGQRVVRVIDTIDRLEHIFDTPKTIINLAQTAEKFANEGLHSPSTQIIFSEPLPFYNSSAEEIVNTIFQLQIPLARPMPEKASQKRKFTIIDKVAKETVASSLRLVAPQSATSYLAADPHIPLLKEGRKKTRTADAQLQTNHGVGCIRGSGYTEKTLKLHLHDAVINIDAAARTLNKQKQCILVLLDPCNQDEALEQIDEITFYTRDNLSIEFDQDPDILAQKADFWASRAA